MSRLQSKRKARTRHEWPIRFDNFDRTRQNWRRSSKKQREDTEVARKEAEKGKQDVETLKSMMAAAGIAPALVEVALGLVRDGKSVQDVVAEALQKSFHL